MGGESERPAPSDAVEIACAWPADEDDPDSFGEWTDLVIDDADDVLDRCRDPEVTLLLRAQEALWKLREWYYELRHDDEEDNDGSWDSLDLPVPVERHRWWPLHRTDD